MSTITYNDLCSTTDRIINGIIKMMIVALLSIYPFMIWMI